MKMKDVKCVEYKCCGCPLRSVCNKCELPFLTRTLEQVANSTPMKKITYKKIMLELEEDV